MLPIFAVYLLWLLWLVAWFVASVAPLRGTHKLSFPEEIVYRLVILAAGALLFTLTPWPGIDVQYRLWHRALENDLAWRLVWVAGVALMIACWALVQRHIAFARGASLVTGGPYALVRHPIYLCLIIANFATAMAFGRPSSFAGAVLFTLAFVSKVVIEEGRTQGPAFAAYKRRTLMFIPALGLVWYGFTWLGQRLRHVLVRDEPVMPAPLPTRPHPVIAAPLDEPLAPLSRLHSVPLELVLDEEMPVAAGEPSGA